MKYVNINGRRLLFSDLLYAEKNIYNKYFLYFRRGKKSYRHYEVKKSIYNKVCLSLVKLKDGASCFSDEIFCNIDNSYLYTYLYGNSVIKFKNCIYKGKQINVKEEDYKEYLKKWKLIKNIEGF